MDEGSVDVVNNGKVIPSVASICGELSRGLSGGSVETLNGRDEVGSFASRHVAPFFPHGDVGCCAFA